MGQNHQETQRVRRWLPYSGIVAISSSVIIASCLVLQRTGAWSARTDVAIVLCSMASLDFILFKMLQPFTPDDFNTRHPNVHVLVNLGIFLITLSNAWYFGVTFAGKTQPPDPIPMATLTIAGMVVPVGASLILAMPARRRNEDEGA
jgi:hypothetical protein